MHDFLEERVLQYGDRVEDRIAVVSKDEILTYKQLQKKILTMVSCLIEKGIRKESVVLLQAVPGAAYITAYIALHIVGAVAVPFDRKLAKNTLEHIRACLDAGYVIGEEKLVTDVAYGLSYEDMASDYLEKLELQYKEGEVWQNGKPIMDRTEEDIYDILYTTGTTGESKGVVTTRESVHVAICNEIEGAQLTENEVVLIPLPLNHSFGIGKMRAVLYMGGTVILWANVSMAAELKKLIDRYQCTGMICVPSALQLICSQAKERIGEVLGVLRFIEVASAPFGREMKQLLMNHLPHTHILNRYGSTETPAAVYLDLNKAPDKIDAIGTPLSNVQVKIVDAEGAEMVSSKEKVGRLAISGRMLLKEYYHSPELTKEVLKDGWLYSRDLAYIDGDNYIYLAGRENDIINTGGRKVSPHEVEDLIMKSGLVKECAVVAIEDPAQILGEVPACIYVPVNSDIREQDILNYLREKIEKYKIPVRFHDTKALPRNYVGKLEYTKLRTFFEK